MSVLDWIERRRRRKRMQAVGRVVDRITILVLVKKVLDIRLFANLLGVSGIVITSKKDK